jgi:RNA polymerase sigma factor (sigma-70 family)
MPNGLDLVPAATPPSDAELAARIANGDRHAEDLLIQRYTRPVLQVLYKRLPHQPDMARDLAQETFIVALIRLRGGGIDDPERLAGFLRKTAIHLVIGELRKAARRRTEVDSASIAGALDAAAGPAGSLERSQAIQIVRELIAEMPVVRDRDLLWRYYVLEHDKVTLCDAFSLSPEHFDRVMHRARSRFKELMEKYDGSTP